MRRLANRFYVVIFILFSTTLEAITFIKTYGGDREDVGFSVRQTSDGGYIIAGYTTSFNLPYVLAYFIKTDTCGDTIWTDLYEGIHGGRAMAYALQETLDGNYAVTGKKSWRYERGFDVWFFKYPKGAYRDKLYGGTGYDCGYSIAQTSDGGYIIAGATESFGAGGSDVYLIKTNSSGDTVWTRTFGGVEYDYGHSVQQTSDGGYIIAGGTKSYGAGGYDVYLIKTNALGDTIWTRTYGSVKDDYGHSTQQTLDGGYIITGGTESYGTWGGVYLIKTNASGDIMWTKIYGGRGAWGSSVQQTSDSGYIIVGYIALQDGDIYLLKTDPSGDTIWTRTYGDRNEDMGMSIQQTSEGGFIITGRKTIFGFSYINDDVYLIKTDPSGNVEGIEEKLSSTLSPLSLKLSAFYPFKIYYTLPSASEVQFEVFDATGRRLKSFALGRKEKRTYKEFLPIGELPSGIYFIRLKTDRGVVIEKGVLLK